jgi:hypothetical protein
MRTDSHPIAFAAGEAIASRASCALIAWETVEGFAWRTYPHASLTVLIGLHDMLGHMIDQMREAAEPEGEDEGDG